MQKKSDRLTLCVVYLHWKICWLFNKINVNQRQTIVNGCVTDFEIIRKHEWPGINIFLFQLLAISNKNESMWLNLIWNFGNGNRECRNPQMEYSSRYIGCKCYCMHVWMDVCIYVLCSLKLPSLITKKDCNYLLKRFSHFQRCKVIQNMMPVSVT